LLQLTFVIDIFISGLLIPNLYIGEERRETYEIINDEILRIHFYNLPISGYGSPRDFIYTFENEDLLILTATEEIDFDSEGHILSRIN